jgi:hypothetical protein
MEVAPARQRDELLDVWPQLLCLRLGGHHAIVREE